MLIFMAKQLRVHKLILRIWLVWMLMENTEKTASYFSYFVTSRSWLTSTPHLGPCPLFGKHIVYVGHTLLLHKPHDSVCR